ncbi:aminopeptidase 2 [Pseudoloma neurophilia]|uniref:Aminopeptidase n=1 Tax=Pseudoloma neurophilia TaxID=146866 RepID=A0A0R0LYM3_9MICR|nr:aminopeptidase 2 [Pseudoloma neurophilia]
MFFIIFLLLPLEMTKDSEEVKTGTIAQIDIETQVKVVPEKTIKDETLEESRKKIKLEQKSAEDIAIDLGYNLDVLPEHYDLKVELDTQNDTFKGVIEIDLIFKKEVDKFMINADEMNISKVLFNKNTVQHSSNKKGNLDILLNETFKEKTGKLQIFFDASINKKNEGFYISNYGENKKMYSTHFEPTDARKAFPCFDHPLMKATFDITIIADKKYTILSNMPVEKELEYSGSEIQKLINTEAEPLVESVDKKIVKFKKMKKTSTYLIAYVVGELEYISEGRISVYSTYNAKLGEYALKVAVHVLEFFEKYFGIEYPLEKLDMVAIPEFSMGAMENWGLVTYRETSLLFNKKTSSMYQKARIAETVAHELAHQWFGNLVTPVWWDDLWLNEGFATWAATLGCEAIRQSQLNLDESKETKKNGELKKETETKKESESKKNGELKKETEPKKNGESKKETESKKESEKESKKNGEWTPEWENKKLIDWKPWLTFIAEDLDRGLDADILDSSHPIKVPVYQPEEINQIFDGISYSKSASLIRMVENYLTPPVFQKKLSEYLKKYAWSNATSDNLFEILSDKENDIKGLMNIWTSKIGFPLITLKNTKLSQSRMLLDKDKNDRSNWPVPLRIRILDGKSEKEANIKMVNFTDPVDVKDLIGENIDESQLLINDGGFGFFRSFYDFPSQVFEKFEQFSTVNRLVFINDQVALAMSKRISFKTMFNLTKKLENEQSPEVFDSATSFLLEMKHVLYDKNESIIEAIKDLVKDRVDFDYKEEKEFEVMRLRSSLLSLAVNHGIEVSVPEDCHPMYLTNFYIQDFQKNNDIEKYLKIYKKSPSEIQSRLLHAMVMTKDFEVYKKAVDLLLTNKIKQQDKTRLAISALGNLDFKEYFIHFFEENFNNLNESMSSSLMMYIVEHTASWTRNLEHFESKMKNYDMTAYEQPYKRGLEKAKYRHLYREAYATGMI